MSNCLLKSPCLLSLQTSGAKYVDNKMPESFQNFLPLQYIHKKKKKKKKLQKTQQQPLYIMSAMPLA